LRHRRSTYRLYPWHTVCHEGHARTNYRASAGLSGKQQRGGSVEIAPTTAARAQIAAQSLTAEDTLQRKQRHESVVSGGRLVATALKGEGVDPIFTLCGSFIIDFYTVSFRSW
jgi:hypothetical protein